MTLALHTLTSLIRRKAVVALLTMLALAGAIGANVAHAEIAVPYHTIPQAAPPVIRYADGSCLFNFYNPSVVLGFVSNEYVYWRPIGAFVASNVWQYRYGEWRRALTSTTKMIRMGEPAVADERLGVLQRRVRRPHASGDESVARVPDLLLVQELHVHGVARSSALLGDAEVAERRGPATGPLRDIRQPCDFTCSL